MRTVLAANFKAHAGLQEDKIVPALGKMVELVDVIEAKDSTNFERALDKARPEVVLLMKRSLLAPDVVAARGGLPPSGDSPRGPRPAEVDVAGRHREACAGRRARLVRRTSSARADGAPGLALRGRGALRRRQAGRPAVGARPRRAEPVRAPAARRALPRHHAVPSPGRGLLRRAREPPERAPSRGARARAAEDLRRRARAASARGGDDARRARGAPRRHGAGDLALGDRPQRAGPRPLPGAARPLSARSSTGFASAAAPSASTTP